MDRPYLSQFIASVREAFWTKEKQPTDVQTSWVIGLNDTLLTPNNFSTTMWSSLIQKVLFDVPSLNVTLCKDVFTLSPSLKNMEKDLTYATSKY